MSDVSYQEFVLESARTLVEGVGWVIPEGASYNEIVILASSVIITGALLPQPTTPTGPSDEAGHTGQLAFDDDFIYVKTSEGWKRSALSAW